MAIRILGLMLVICTTPAWARPDDYRFDPVHTQIMFQVSHLGFSRSSGRFHVKSGYIHFDADDWSSARVEAIIDVASLDLGDADWEKTLLSYQFFDVKAHPVARFVSARAEKTGSNTGVVHGQFSLHGVTRPLDLAVTFNKAGVHAYSLHYVAGFSASARIKRSDYNMKKYLPGVGDDIELHIEAEGLRDRRAEENTEQVAPESGADQHDQQP